MAEAAFQFLHPELRRLLLELEFAEATDAQRRALPAIGSGRHALLIAPTGYGKTEGALLPILDNLLKARDAYREKGKALPPGIKILYVTPLRALNRDLLKRLTEWAKLLGFEIGVRHSDTTQAERRRQALHPPDLLITTPETLQIAFAGSRLRANLKTVRWLVVDEIHELATSERGYQLAVALERLEEVVAPEGKGVPSGFQRVGLSATVGSPATVARLLGGVGREVEVVEVKADKKIELRVELPQPTKEDEPVAAKILAAPQQAALLRRLRTLVEGSRSTLVFSNTRDGAELLASRMRLHDAEFPIGVHHGSLSRDARIEAEEAYKDGAVRALICTSSLELGIDVGTTDLVVQVSSPRGIERLLQRVGRSGHVSGAVSRGVVLTNGGEDAAEAAVIARRALDRSLEDIEIRRNPLAVLANQLIHFTVERGEVEVGWAVRVLRRAAPFAELTETTVLDVLRQLHGQGTVTLDEAGRRFTRRASARRYFIDNVSMIPDEKTYRVVDSVTRRTVGTLDEDFVLGFLDAGAQFIMRGRTWSVLEVQEEAVLVAESDTLGALPSWQGEDLPVPWSVAVAVGRLRRLVADGRVEEARREFPMDDAAFAAFRADIDAQLRKKMAVPSDEVVTIESGPRLTIVNTCFGTRTNEALARALGALLSHRTGDVVAGTSDAYRVFLESRREIPSTMVREVLLSLEPNTLESLLKLVLKNSTFVKYQMIHVARKFGALGRSVDAQRFSMRRLLELYHSMPLFDEAIDRILWGRMDLPHLTAALKSLREGTVTIREQRLSPLGMLGREREAKQLSAERAEPSILESLKKRLEDHKVFLSCVMCGRVRETRTGDVPGRPVCGACGSIMLAPLGRYEKDVARLVKKRDRTEDEDRLVQRMTNEAHLVATYGKKAVLALAGRGVGPETAARILAKLRDTEVDFLRDVLAAEINYARTRSFWD
ncbi:MAG: DEAD/DEAH box helicase [Euryarchaeota archaeon]|nr:DEAD/DEAH box helicase [Euryarchaeota archaeon]